MSQNRSKQIEILDEATLRLLSEASPLGIFVADLSNHLIYANARFQETMGLTLEQSLDMGWIKAIHPEDQGKIIVAEGLTDITRRLPITNTLRYLHADGKVVWTSLTITAILEEGVIQGFLGTSEDITEQKRIKKALDSHAANLEALLESAGAAVYSLDRDLRYTLFNHVYEDVMAKKRGLDVHIGDCILDVLSKSHGSDKEIMEKVFAQVLAGTPYFGVVDLGEPGSYRAPIELACNPVRDEANAVTGIAVFARDLSEVFRIQKESEEKTQLLSTLLENLPVVVYRVNAEGIITLSMGAGLRALGLGDNEVVGYSALEVMPDVKEHFENALKGKLSSFISKGYRPGQELHYQQMLFSDPFSGGIIGLGLDITAAKLAERENEEKTILLNSLVQNLPIIVYKINKEGVCTLSIGKGLGILGLKDNEVVGANMYEIYKDGEHPLRRAMAGELDRNVQKMPLPGGDIFFQNTFFSDPSDPGGLIGVALDVTASKLAEDEIVKAKEMAESAAIAKQQFLSNMSHEIRTPLNAIIGMTHIMLQDELNPEQENNLRILKFSGENLLALVNDILDYSKIIAGKIEFENIDFHLSDFINSIKQSHQFKAAEKRISLKMKMDSDLPDSLNGDPVRLAQILNNLISNALKFTPEDGSVTVDLSLNKQDKQAAEIDFSIKDTGIGIEPFQREYIFENFTQASADTTRRFGGTGLGLAITKRLLELQGSAIHVDSEVGKGSNFYFRLNIKKSEMEQRTMNSPTFSGSQAETQNLSGFKVLLAEDNEMNRIVASKFMNRWALHVGFAQNGEEAVEAAKAEAYDLVLMDLQMPKMDGYEATRQIRAIPENNYATVPIVALTASVEPEIVERIKHAGMDDYVSKPFNPNELYKKIASHLMQYRQRHPNR